MPIWSSEAKHIASSPGLLRGADIQKPAVTLLSICPDALTHGYSMAVLLLIQDLRWYFFLVASLNSTTWCVLGFLLRRIETNAEEHYCSFSHSNLEHTRRQRAAVKEQVKGKEAGTGLVPKDWELKTIWTPPLSHCKPACLPNTCVDRPQKTTSSLPIPKAKL